MAFYIPPEIIKNENKEAVIDAAQEYLECDQIIYYEDEMIVGVFPEILKNETELLEFLGIDENEVAMERSFEMISQELREKINKKVRMYCDPNAEEKIEDYFSPYIPSCKVIPMSFIEDKDNWFYYAPGFVENNRLPEGLHTITAGEHFWKKVWNALAGKVNHDIFNYKLFMEIGLDHEEYCVGEKVPPKEAIYALVLKHHLDLRTMDELLEIGGREFAKNSKREWVFKECIRNKVYELKDINMLLNDNGEEPLMYNW